MWFGHFDGLQLLRRRERPAASCVWALALWCARVSWCASLPVPVIAPEKTLPILLPGQAAFPEASLVDFSVSLDPPAGKRGFLFVGTDGRFYFEDGSRGRFWGINIAKDSVFVPRETIDQIAGVVSRAGFNLVRLHHIDGTEGLLPSQRAGKPDRLDPDKLDAVFYWVHALKQRGVYVYLDLLDYRTFHEAEGVPQGPALGRGAKPAAVFNERLIELQIAYARDLLIEHTNPYTNLPLGSDPAVAMIELCDENGLFARIGKWEEMPRRYFIELQKRWNFWLRGRYGSTEALRAAWQDTGGRPPLGVDERIEDGSVRLLATPPAVPDFPSPTGEPLVGSLTKARQLDLVRFCASVHREYFAEMKRALREAGVRAPITAVTDWETPADLCSVAAELDFIACNWYYDHPVFSAGREWRLPSFFTNRNPIAEEQGQDFVSSVLRAAVVGKPLVVREWGGCWPGKFRGVALVEATAYALLHEIDALIMFTYNTHPDMRRVEYFDVSSDPVRWGLVGAAGHIFRTRALDAAPSSTTVRLTEDDVLSLDALPPSLLRLGWVSGLRQLLPSCTAIPSGEVIPAAEGLGRTGDVGAYVSATRQIIRLIDEERLLLDAPRVQAVAGALSARPMRTSIAAFTSPSPIGVMMAVSLNHKSIADSDALLVKMVTVAVNTGEQKTTREGPPNSPRFKLESFGDAPVLTHGKASDIPARIEIAGKPLVAAHLENGTWEAVLDGETWYVWCDTPGARFSLPSLGPQITVTRFTSTGVGSTEHLAQPFSHPSDCLFVRVVSDQP